MGLLEIFEQSIHRRIVATMDYIKPYAIYTKFLCLKYISATVVPCKLVGRLGQKTKKRIEAYRDDCEYK